MSITQTFDLNLIPEQAPVVVHCDQYDKGTGRLIVKLYEGDVAYTPSGTAVIQGCKPDGHGFQYNATLSENTVTANLTEQMTAVAGHVRCQIVVTETTGRTGTFVFILEVQKSALPSDTDMSDSEYQLIEQAIEDAQQAVEDSQDAAEDAEAWAVGERGGVPVGPTDPTYHNNSYYWSQQAQSAKDLDDLNDVTITTPSNNQVLTYNNGEWVNANAQGGPTSLDNLTNVDITTPTDGQFLKYDAANQEWINGSGGGGGATDLDDLTDVSISSPANGQVLKYNSTSQEWENANESGGGATDLDDLSDVTITTPSDGQALLYDAANQIWKNGTVSGGGGDYVGLYGMTEIQSSDGQGTTLLDLNQYTSVGNYYCNGKAQISVPIYRYTSPSLRSGSVTITYSSAIFILYVRKMPNNDTVQEMYIKEGDATVYAVLRRYKSSNGWTNWSAGESRSYNGKMPAMYLYSLQGVYIDVEVPGDAFVYDGSISEWTNKPIGEATGLASINVTGGANTTGATINKGTYFYLDGILVRAKTNIANGASYTLNTNYEVVTAGALNTLSLGRKVLATAAANQSYAAQMATLAATFSTLSQVERERCIIRNGGSSVYQYITGYNFMRFTYSSSSTPANGYTFFVIDLNLKLYQSQALSTGTVTDRTLNTSTNALTLEILDIE